MPGNPWEAVAGEGSQAAVAAGEGSQVAEGEGSHLAEVDNLEAVDVWRWGESIIFYDVIQEEVTHTRLFLFKACT